MSATSAAGGASAATGAVRVTYAAPAAAGGLLDEIFDQGSGVQSVPTAQDFTGANLRFSVTGAGASIDPATGVVSIATDVALSGEVIRVTATNSGGSATSVFPLTIEAAEPAPAIGRMDPPALVPASLRSTRLAVALAAAPDLGGAGLFGFDLRYAQSMTSDSVPQEGETAVVYSEIEDAEPLVRLTSLAAGRFVHLQTRPQTDAGPGPWSDPLVVALPAADAPVFLDTFATGTHGAAVNAAGRKPDVGPVWQSFGGGELRLVQPEGRATHGGGSINLGNRSAKVMAFDGGYWAGAGGTLEVDLYIGTDTGDRCNVLISSVDGTAFLRVMVRNHGSDNLRFNLWLKNAGVDAAVTSGIAGMIPQFTQNAVNTLRIVRDGGTLRIALNGVQEMTVSGLTGLPAGTRWGVGGDGTDGRPAWFDAVRFSDLPAPPLSSGAQPLGKIALDSALAGTLLTKEA